MRPLSPCVSVCILEPATGYCRGCWRTIGEIAGWLDMSDEGKRAVLAALPQRKVAASPAKRDY